MERISINPKIHFGMPCVSGTRIPVKNVLELVNENIPFDQIISEYYPDLSIFDIMSCIQYSVSLMASEGIDITSGET